MSESNDGPDPYLLQLIFMFQGAAFQHMGKVVNPATQEVDRDLDQARHAIDLLSMLETKTRGNLTEDEAKLLEHTLFELRMNFVEEQKKGSSPSPDAADTDSADPAPSNDSEPGDDSGEDS
jgi:hypothetical protein